jgi:hypothetical protein
MTLSRCRCDGRYEGCTHGHRCDEPPSPTRPWWLWCEPCNSRRLAHIDKGMEALNARFGNLADPVTAEQDDGPHQM